MNLSDFDFDLPEALIATRPARPRTAARLLLAEGDRIRDLHVRDLLDIFRPGDRLVLNNTRVLPARLFGQRQRGAAVARSRSRCWTLRHKAGARSPSRCAKSSRAR